MERCLFFVVVVFIYLFISRSEIPHQPSGGWREMGFLSLDAFVYYNQCIDEYISARFFLAASPNAEMLAINSVFM